MSDEALWVMAVIALVLVLSLTAFSAVMGLL